MKQKILVVEDEPDIMHIVTQALTTAGYDVVQAYGGEDALRKVKEHHPDLVLTDLAMPKVSGVEVIHTLKSDPRTHNIPIIAVTAHMWDGLAQSAGQVGCDAYIAKPFTKKELIDEVREHLKLQMGPAMNAKILVVEDEPDVMRIITHALTGAGHQVIPAYGGEDAIRKVKTHKPDLVLTDLAMPKVSGVEVIDSIKSDPETEDIPVIAVTAHMWDALAQSAGQVGCDGYVSKPFNTRQLLQEVQKHLKSKPAA